MVKITVLYPNTAGAKFDMEYYCQKHMGLVKRLLGPAVKGISVDQGISGQAPGSPAPFIAVGQVLFDSLEAFQAALGPHAQTIMGDIVNYTNLEPIVLMSEVKM